MVLFNKKEDCCGCSACKCACPKSAIKMLPDEEGFLYPNIDKTLCIKCGACVKICVFKNGYNTVSNLGNPLVYAVRHRNIREVETSRSGAMFIAISDYVLDRKGSVYGVGYTDHFRVVHKRAVTKQERNEFKGSKYVQSDINETYVGVKKDLHNGLIVLFSGTPCQTAGLDSYLKNVDTSNLFICDIVCHGAPSPFIWRDYLAYLEKKYKDKIISVDFRDKSCGWGSHEESFKLKKHSKKIVRKTFTNLFYGHIMLRPSCGECKYSNFKRPSDITLADYWGWEKISSSFNADDKGVSLVLINTQKGQKLFNLVEQYIDKLESTIDKCIQPNLQQPTKISPLRDFFWDKYKKHGFKFVEKKYGNSGLFKKALKLAYIIKRIISK